MSGSLVIEINSGKSYRKGSRFVCPPEIVASVSGPGPTYVRISRPLTMNMGAKLRDLADKADAAWAEYYRPGQGKNRAACEVEL